MNRISNLLILGLIASQSWASIVVGGLSRSTVVTDLFHIAGSSDVIGNQLQFDAQSIQVTTGPGTLTIDVRTNFDNSALHSFRDTGVRLDIGDLFFTVNGTYSYGIPLA